MSLLDLVKGEIEKTSVLDLVKDEIEKTIQSLEAKTFLADPIAGPHFSKITSVISSV